MSKRLSFSVLAAAAALVGSAKAAEFFTDVEIQGGAKSTVLTSLTAVSLDVWTYLQDADGIASNSCPIKNSFGMTSGNGGLKGDFDEGTVVTPFDNGPGPHPGITSDRDGDGDLDVGTTATNTNGISFFQWNPATSFNNAAANAGVRLITFGGTQFRGYLVGQFVWTPQAGAANGSSTLLNAVQGVPGTVKNTQYFLDTRTASLLSSITGVDPKILAGGLGPVTVLFSTGSVPTSSIALAAAATGTNRGAVTVVGANGSYSAGDLDLIPDAADGNVQINGLTNGPADGPVIALLDVEGTAQNVAALFAALQAGQGTAYTLNPWIPGSNPSFAGKGTDYEFIVTFADPNAASPLFVNFNFAPNNVVLDQISVVPEPTTLGLVGLSMLGLVRRRRVA